MYFFWERERVPVAVKGERKSKSMLSVVPDVGIDLETPRSWPEPNIKNYIDYWIDGNKLFRTIHRYDWGEGTYLGTFTIFMFKVKIFPSKTPWLYNRCNVQEINFYWGDHILKSSFLENMNCLTEICLNCIGNILWMIPPHPQKVGINLWLNRSLNDV